MLGKSEKLVVQTFLRNTSEMFQIPSKFTTSSIQFNNLVNKTVPHKQRAIHECGYRGILTQIGCDSICPLKVEESSSLS